MGVISDLNSFYFLMLLFKCRVIKTILNVYVFTFSFTVVAHSLSPLCLPIVSVHV